MKSDQEAASGRGQPDGESKTDWAKVRANGPYVWDGINEDDRPLTKEEMQAGIDAFRRQREQAGRKARS